MENTSRRIIMQYVLIGVYLCLTVAGLIFMKLRGKSGVFGCEGWYNYFGDEYC